MHKPYPIIQVQKRNKDYGMMMLDNAGGMISEMSALSLYLYNRIITQNSHQQLSELFYQMSVDEKQHLDIFLQLAYQLGLDPRLWSCHQDFNEYWSPSFNNYPCQIESLLRNAIQNKMITIDKYTKQCHIINDPYIYSIIQRIIKDENQHLILLRKYVKLVRTSF